MDGYNTGMNHNAKVTDETKRFDKFAPSIESWKKCQVTGAIYKSSYSTASIETNLQLIKHFLKHLEFDFSNIKQAYISTKMETAHMKPKSQVRLYYAVVSYVKSLVEVGIKCS